MWGLNVALVIDKGMGEAGDVETLGHAQERIRATAVQRQLGAGTQTCVWGRMRPVWMRKKNVNPGVARLCGGLSRGHSDVRTQNCVKTKRRFSRCAGAFKRSVWSWPSPRVDVKVCIKHSMT